MGTLSHVNIAGVLTDWAALIEGGAWVGSSEGGIAVGCDWRAEIAVPLRVVTVVTIAKVISRATQPLPTRLRENLSGGESPMVAALIARLRCNSR